MVTAKEIREVRFSRGLRGYETAEVDAFLDQCTAAVEALTAEKEENVRKMQVLAETVVDYRKQEDSIRTAVLNAQRMSDQVLEDARKQAAELVENAQKEADELLEKARQEAAGMREATQKSIVDEREELARVKSEVAAFKARLMATYREHLTLIGVLPDEETPEDSADAADAAAPAAADRAAAPVELTQPTEKTEEPAAFTWTETPAADAPSAAAPAVHAAAGEEPPMPKIDLSAFRFEEE